MTSWNFSPAAVAARLAISGLLAALSAVTYRPLAWARKAMYPPPRLIWSNCSHGPIAVRLAISGELPALSAVT